MEKSLLKKQKRNMYYPSYEEDVGILLNVNEWMETDPHYKPSRRNQQVKEK